MADKYTMPSSTGAKFDTRYVSGYSGLVIRSFRHKGLKRLFKDGDQKGVHQDMRIGIENILFVLNRPKRPDDMNLPGLRPHPLKGDLKGFWAVTVRANWRIIFRFAGGDATDVDLVDYQ